MSNLPSDLADLSIVIDDFNTKYASITRAQLVFHHLDDLRADGGVGSLTAALLAGAAVLILNPVPHILVRVADGVVHATAQSGAMFRVRMDRSSPLFFEAAGDGVQNDAAAFALLEASDAVEIDLLGRDYRVAGSFVTAKPIVNGRVIDDTRTWDFRPLTENRLATTPEAVAGLPADKVARVADIAAIVTAQLAAQAAPNLVQTVYSGTASYASAASLEIAEMTTTITTLKDASRVRVLIRISFERESNGMFFVTRNGVELFSNSAASPGQRTLGIAPVTVDGNTSSTMTQVAIDFIDTVGVAGDYEYRVGVRGQAQPFHLNRTSADTDTNSFERGTSILILEEIPA